MLFLAKHMLPLLQKVFNINIPSIRKPVNSIALWAPLFSRNFSGLLLFLAHIQKNTANDALGTTPLPVVFSFALILLFSCKEFVACGTLAREPYYEILHCSSCPVRSPRTGKKIICCFFLLCFLHFMDHRSSLHGLLCHLQTCLWRVQPHGRGWGLFWFFTSSQTVENHTVCQGSEKWRG